MLSYRIVSYIIISYVIVSYIIVYHSIVYHSIVYYRISWLVLSSLGLERKQYNKKWARLDDDSIIGHTKLLFLPIEGVVWCGVFTSVLTSVLTVNSVFRA